MAALAEYGYEEDAIVTHGGQAFGAELKGVYYLNDQLARQMSAADEDLAGLPVASWQVTGVELKAFAEAAGRYQGASPWGVLDFADQPGGAFLWLDAEAAGVLTGLDASEIGGDDAQAAVEVVFNAFAGRFMSVWQDLAAFDVQVYPSPSAPSLEDLQSMFPGLVSNTPVIVTSFRLVGAGGHTARATLALPQAYVLSIGSGLAALGASAFDATDTSRYAERLAYLDDLPIPVLAILGKAVMTVADVQGLEPGDVIGLDSTVGLPVPVKIGSIFFEGRPGTTTDGRRLAVQLAMPLPEGY